MKNLLDSRIIDPHRIVLFSDAYDTLLVEHAEVVIDKFLSLNSDLVLGAESHFWPPEGRDAQRARFECCGSKWAFPNSGGYIGYGWAIQRMIDYCSSRIERGDYGYHKPDDQALVQDFYLDNIEQRQSKIHLDTECEIFACLNTSEHDFVIDRGKVRRRQTGRSTAVLHANADKNNMNILYKYSALLGSCNSFSGRMPDIRIGQGEGKFIHYEPAIRKLVATDTLGESSVIFLVKGERQALAFSPQSGLLTFTPEGEVHSDGTVVSLWEVLELQRDGRSDRATARSYHGLPLGAFCRDCGSGEIFLEALPLAHLLQPSFDGLLEMTAAYAARF